MMKIYRTQDKQLTRVDEIGEGCWVCLNSPDENEARLVASTLDIEPADLMAATDPEESARISLEDGYTLIIVDIPYVEAEGNGYSYTTVPLGIIMVDDVIITVSTRESTIITDFTEERIRGFWTFKRTRFILQLLHRNASRFLAYLKQIDKASMFVQTRLEASMRNQELLQMMKLEKSLVYFSTSLKGNEMVLEKMLRMDMLRKYPDDSDLLEDVIIENKQAMEMCAIYRDIMSGTMDAFASIISNNLNITMKVLTSLTMVLSVPTIIASLWGMNVHVPFEDSGFGFWFVIGLTAVCSLLAFLLMYKKRMFK